ncbi:MAG: thioesterase family protein [Alistipes sp.]
MKKREQTAALTCETPIRVRFSEVDSMQVVWHGEYIRYFEDGREDFGRRFAGLGYADLAKSGYLVPVVDAALQFKSPLRIDDTAVVETRYIDTDAAKICFEYTIRRQRDGEIVATGSTMQVFVDFDYNLCLTQPDFYIEWKNKWLK